MFKKVVLTLMIFAAIGAIMPAKADDIDSARPNVQYTSYKDCIKLYKLPPDKLFFLALSSVNANKFEIAEMQSRNNYIIFTDGKREFLLSILKKDKYFSFLKISPCDNNYYFSPQIPFKIFNYVDLNFNAEVKELKF